MDPAPTVYETLASGSPLQMVPAIRNILGGFLFSGDDVYKHVRVLSGGERTRLAVARMLLRPSNTLLLDEPTNHLDLDSKEVLLDALVDYGGTLIFVSHDRYFVERLATKIIEVGNGTRRRLSRAPTRSSCGTRSTPDAGRQDGRDRRAAKADAAARSRRDAEARRRVRTAAAAAEQTPRRASSSPQAATKPSHEEKKRADAEARKKQQAPQARARRGSPTLEARIAETEARDPRDRADRWRRPGSTRTAPPPSRSSTAIRP